VRYPETIAIAAATARNISSLGADTPLSAKAEALSAKGTPPLRGSRPADGNPNALNTLS
jgi:hypothetical protein